MAVMCSTGSEWSSQVGIMSLKKPSTKPVGERSCCGKVFWIFRNFSIYLALLIAGVIIALAIAAKAIGDTRKAVRSLLLIVEVDANTVTDAMTAVTTVLTVSWIALGVLLAGIVYYLIFKYVMSAKRDAVRANAEDHRSKCFCMTEAFTRLIYNLTHLLAILLTIWFIILLIVQVVLFIAFLFTDEVSSQAGKFWMDTLEEVEDIVYDSTSLQSELENVSTSLRQMCDRAANLPAGVPLAGAAAGPNCNDDMYGALDTLDTMAARMARARAAGSEECRSAACVNMDTLWFTDQTGCLCDPDKIYQAQATAAAGKDDALRGAIALAVVVVLMILIVSKTAMNLEGLLKDMKWQRYMRSVQHELEDVKTGALPIEVDDDAATSSSGTHTAHHHKEIKGAPSTTNV